MAYFQSPITEQPLLDAGTLASLYGTFNAPTASAVAPSAATPGSLIGGAAQDYLNQNYGSLIGQGNAQGLVGFENAYDPAASQLSMAQQSANATLGNEANQYELGQQQSGLNRINAGRQQGMNNLTFLNNLLGGLI